MKPKNIKRLQTQSRKLKVRELRKDTFAVASVSTEGADHIVSVNFGRYGVVRARCTCPWAANRGVGCSHVMAVLDHLAAKKGRTLSFWRSKHDAQRQKQRLFYLVGSDRNDGVWITSRAA